MYCHPWACSAASVAAASVMEIEMENDGDCQQAMDRQTDGGRQKWTCSQSPFSLVTMYIKALVALTQQLNHVLDSGGRLTDCHAILYLVRGWVE